MGILHIVRSEHTEGFVAVSKTLANVGHLKNCTKNMFFRDVRGAGADFLRSFAFWSIRSSGLVR